MTGTDEVRRHTEIAIDRAPVEPLRHQWPQLGQELFELEHTLTDIPGVGRQPLTEQEKKEQQAYIRNTIISHVYHEEENHSLDMRYLAFLLLKQGRAGIIVDNPYTIEKNGNRLDLPYTGLEGYYAGVEKTANRPGLTSEEIVQEEATVGTQLLKNLKTRAIERNSWNDFIHLKKALARTEQDIEIISTIQLLWGTVIRRLHVRIYHCPEFEPTLTEQIEDLERLPGASQSNSEEGTKLRRALEATRGRLHREHEAMSNDARKQERLERRRREWMREDRLTEFHRFHDETYQILTTSQQGRYSLDVRDATLKDATVIETITLPTIPDRQTYPPTLVHLTPEQLEGYLFLATFGDVGGDPLARSVLVDR
jgi:hypothetical protein